MIDQLLELGEIGILRDIPSELSQLTNENGFLMQENAKLKSRNRILLIILVGVSVYIVYKKYFKPNRETEEYESNDS